MSFTTFTPQTNAAQAEGAGEIRGTDASDNWVRLLDLLYDVRRVNETIRCEQFSHGASTKGVLCESNESPDPTVAAV